MTEPSKFIPVGNVGHEIFEVYFRTPDGCTHKIHPEFVRFFQSFLSKNVGIGSSPTNPIPVPKRVDKTTLELILLYFKGRIAQPENAVIAFSKKYFNIIFKTNPYRLTMIGLASVELELTELSELFQLHKPKIRKKNDKRFMAKVEDIMEKFVADRQQDVGELARQIESVSGSTSAHQKKNNMKKHVSKAVALELPNDVSGLAL